jgi:hypothetical protein
MNTTTQWISALALCTIALTGCGGREEARPAIDARGSGPAAALRPDPSAAAAAAPACPTPTPGVAATPASDSDRAAQGAIQGKSAPGTRKSPAATAHASAKLSVKRLVVAQGVKNREPVEAGTTFSAYTTERIYAFVEVENESQSEGELTVAFIPPGGGPAVGNVTLEVGATPRWRTWAYTRGAQKTGEWTAVVRSETGEVLARAPFEITL